MAEFTEARRPATLDLLKLHGPSNVPRLARLRGVNRTAVRQQLTALERRKKGRPTHVYALTPTVEALFPQGYGPMALTLLRELARIRDEEGYMARGRGCVLTENHCPIAAVAREFPQVCRFEKKLFEKVLGTPLERIEHIGSGERACVYVPRNG